MPEVLCSTPALQYPHQLGLRHHLRELYGIKPLLDQLKRLGLRLDTATREAILKLAGEQV